MSNLVRIVLPEATLEGDLQLPPSARGLVLFAHGSGSSRHSPRNRFVAGQLQSRGLGTLLMDLLTAEEEAADDRTGHLRFDIALLADRLGGAIDWLATNVQTEKLEIGLFGASTGGGAALVAAAKRPERIRAVVSRGGRPDLAGEALGEVKAATLLIVGGEDGAVIGMNRDAFKQMHCERRVEVIPGASHLFEEPGTLEEVARLAGDWFVKYLK